MIHIIFPLHYSIIISHNICMEYYPTNNYGITTIYTHHIPHLCTRLLWYPTIIVSHYYTFFKYPHHIPTQLITYVHYYPTSLSFKVIPQWSPFFRPLMPCGSACHWSAWQSCGASRPRPRCPGVPFIWLTMMGWNITVHECSWYDNHITGEIWWIDVNSVKCDKTIRHHPVIWWYFKHDFNHQALFTICLQL